MSRFDAAACIGRFQPPHRAHLALVQEALAIAPWAVVVLGSAFQARTPKNPFTWQERAEMIRLTLPAADRGRVLFVPVRDLYDEPRWAASVRRAVAHVLAGCGVTTRAVALVGHFKDATSDYLHAFPDWRLQRLERLPAADGTTVRDIWFGAAGGDVGAALQSLAGELPDSTLAGLRDASARPHFAALAEEWRMLRSYHEAWAVAPYPPVFVTVDAAVVCAGHVLLIRRGQAPGKGLYALPGGFIEQRETVWQSTLRELQEETALDLPAATMRRALRATVVFDHPDRSQRGRLITHASHFELELREPPPATAGDDAASVQWVPIEMLASLEDCFHDDHFHILDHFLGLTGTSAGPEDVAHPLPPERAP